MPDKLLKWNFQTFFKHIERLRVDILDILDIS